MKVEIDKLQNYILSDIIGLSVEDQRVLEEEFKDRFGRIPQKMRPSAERSFLNEDAIYQQLHSSQRASRKGKLSFLMTIRWVLILANLASLSTSILSGIFVVYLSRALGYSFDSFLLGVGVLGVSIAAVFVTDILIRNYYRVLYHFLSNGDLIWFMNNDINYYVDAGASKEYAALFGKGKNFDKKNVSIEIIRKKAAKFDPNKTYPSKTTYVYLLCFDYLVSRNESIYDEEKTRKILVDLATRILVFEGRSAFSFYFVGYQYFKLRDLEKATEHFRSAFSMDSNNGNYELMYLSSEYLLKSAVQIAG